jgi:hypothetical protein
MDMPYLAADVPRRPAWSSMEHRYGDRRAANLPVRLLLPPREVVLGRVRDISLSGAFVQTYRELPAMTRVLVELRTPAGSGQVTRQRIAGFVVRNGATGVGIEWAEFAPGMVRDHWTALAAAPAIADQTSIERKRRRALERRILLGRDWLVYYPLGEPLRRAQTPAFTNKPTQS